jgi:hypothetical protein
LNLVDEHDDYTNDHDADYSDYVYEDSFDDVTKSLLTTAIMTTSTSTRIQSTSLSPYGGDISIDDINSVSYYDYDEQDMYIDDDAEDETITQQLVSTSSPVTTVFHIPSYHRRRPVIWNLSYNNNNHNNNNDDDDDDDRRITYWQRNSSMVLTSSLLAFMFLVLMLFEC